MKTIIIIASIVAAISGLKVEHITGTTPPPINCPNSYCDGKVDGNYALYDNRHYFVQCVYGAAQCQACWPLSLEFSEGCNQCLYSKHDNCVTTEPWTAATTFECPDKCPHKGPGFSGNMADPYNARQYVACWQGATVGCIACPGNLEFSEEWNACLYEGKYKTQPTSH